MPSFRFPHYAWIILFTCFVNLFINYAVQLGYGVILPEMIQELNFSRTAAGTIFNAYLIISNALIICSLLGIISIGNSWQMLYVWVGCFALFYGATFPLYGACAGDYFPKKVIATVAGAWTPFYGLGAISAHWITGWMRDTIGTYHFAFAIAAVMSFFAIIMIRFVRKTGR